MRATYPAYALPVIAPLSLASARPLAAAARSKSGVWRAAAWPLLTAAVLFPILRSALLPDPDIDPQPPRVAAYLRAHLPGRPSMS